MVPFYPTRCSVVPTCRTPSCAPSSTAGPWLKRPETAETAETGAAVRCTAFAAPCRCPDTPGCQRGR